MENKYIILGDHLQFGVVDFHTDLITSIYTRADVRGGGRWYQDVKEKYILLYSLSSDFGFAAVADLKEALLKTTFSPGWQGVNIYWSNAHRLDEAINEKQIIYTIP